MSLPRSRSRSSRGVRRFPCSNQANIFWRQIAHANRGDEGGHILPFLTAATPEAEAAQEKED